MKAKSYYFVGSVVPEGFERLYVDGHSPTIKTQQNFFAGLIKNGVKPDGIVSVLPVRRYPKTMHLSLRNPPVKWRQIPIYFLGLVNVEPCKTLILGVQSFFKLSSWIRTKKQENQEPCLVLYNMGPTHQSILFYWLLVVVFRAKIVSMITDVDVPRYKNRFSLEYWIELIIYLSQTFGIRKLNRVICLNHHVVDDFSLTQPSYVMEGLVADEAFVKKLAGLPASQLPKDTIVLMYMGSLDQVRGIDLLLEVFCEMDDPDFRLLVSGRGDYAKEVERLADVDSRIEYLGFLSNNQERLRVISNVDVLVNPHRCEYGPGRYLFPSKLMEYMASGRLVVSTDHGGVKDSWGEYILVSEGDSVEDLIKALCSVKHLRAEDWRRRVEQGRKIVLEEKMWDLQASKLASFIQEA